MTEVTNPLIHTKTELVKAMVAIREVDNSMSKAVDILMQYQKTLPSDSDISPYLLTAAGGIAGYNSIINKIHNDMMDMVDRCEKLSTYKVKQTKPVIGGDK